MPASPTIPPGAPQCSVPAAATGEGRVLKQTQPVRGKRIMPHTLRPFSVWFAVVVTMLGTPPPQPLLAPVAVFQAPVTHPMNWAEKSAMSCCIHGQVMADFLPILTISIKI
jgi:hypothetical protein